MLADQMDRMIALAEEAQGEETWAFDALSRFVVGCVGAGLDPLGAVSGARAGDVAAATETRTAGAAAGDGAAGGRLLKVLGEIVQAGHGEGALRADVGVGDVVGVVGLLVRGVPTVPGGLGEELRERGARLVLAGMRAHPAPLPPGAALTAEELVRRVSG
ncbi:hypothetical protein [Nonomuraea gerenzanensis]|uniref:Uncharacterized protein n=1 Tax=Nonomuraea gerenzanensis TaxID=93944 RepID=A0A1M4ENX5_9ACTN|nr:hypothetical protein [Nonomuraea gerenzanensis]UBU12009.1 hypothetical protein LCN96_48230 [Nonomuraea gerenzanensis]SBP00524.1 hypothetical protein BN4615_P10040 [Nonomuraea gerenzanensis]